MVYLFVIKEANMAKHTKKLTILPSRLRRYTKGFMSMRADNKELNES